MTTSAEVDDFFENPGGANRNEPPREKGTGRYLLPDPDNPAAGRDKSWMRTTTLAKTLEDTFHLDLWKQRMVLIGIGLRPDLYALAASTPSTDKENLNKIAEDALAAAGSGSGANMGTALHAFTGTLDRGEDVSKIPDAFRPDIVAYHQKLVELGIKPLPKYVERTGLNTDFGAAGTFDRIYQLPDGTLAIGDLKTQKTMDFGVDSMAIQLAVYAHFKVIRDFETAQYEPMPDVSKDFAIVVHLPVGKATATVYRINIRQGYHGARLAAEAREYRKLKTLAAPWVPGIEVKTVTNYAAQAASPVNGAVLAAAQIVNGASTDPATVAAAQRVIQRAQTPPGEPMAFTPGLDMEDGPSPTDAVSGDLLTREQHIEQLAKQSKAYLQAELRKLIPDANVSKYRSKLAAEIVDERVRRGFVQLADEHDNAPTPHEVGNPEGPTGVDDLASTDAYVTAEEMPGTGFADSAMATIAAAKADPVPEPVPSGVSSRAAVLEATPAPEFNPFSDPEPEPADPREPYAARMRVAESRQELAKIWEELTAAGLQSPEMQSIGAARMNELKAAGKA